MKIFLWVLIFSSQQIAFSQDSEPVDAPAPRNFTQSAPISISEDGLAGKKGEDEATMKAREELSRSLIKKVKEDQKTPEEPVQKEASAPEPEPESESASAPAQKQKSDLVAEKKKEKNWTKDFRFEGQTTFFQFSWGVLNSSWSDVDATLEDGSFATGFSLGRFVHQNFSLSTGIEFVHPKEEQWVPEETRLFQWQTTLNYHHKINKSFSLLGSTSVLVSDWNVRKKLSTQDGRETYQSFGSGSAFGLRPSFAARFKVSKSFQVDLLNSWTQYFGSPQKDFGGWGTSLRLVFSL